MKITRARICTHGKGRRTINDELDKNLLTIANYMTEKAVHAAGMLAMVDFGSKHCVFGQAAMVDSLTGPSGYYKATHEHKSTI